jgi:hypothetical protein
MGHKRKRPSFETPRKRAALRMTAVYEGDSGLVGTPPDASRSATLPTLRIYLTATGDTVEPVPP